MAARNFCFCVLLALAAGNLIMAEEEKAWPMSINPMDFFNMFLSGLNSSRSKREADPQNRFLPYFDRCNYTTQPGAQCRDCNSAIRCYSSNVGLVRQCRGLFQYCNNGRCSTSPGSLCNSDSGSNSTSTNSTSTNSTSG